MIAWGGRTDPIAAVTVAAAATDACVATASASRRRPPSSSPTRPHRLGARQAKAARQLLLPESAALPSNDEIEAALASYHALFAADEHDASLRAQRRVALDWMKRFAAWDPVLVGGVAAGWATTHSDIRLELVADDAKAVEIALANEGVRYAALPPREANAGAELLIETPRASLRVAVLTPAARRNRPRRTEDPRLSTADVAALLTDT